MPRPLQKPIQKLVNMLVKPVGLKTVRRVHASRRNQEAAWGRLRTALEAYEALFRREVAPGLPRNGRRLDLLQRTIGTPPAEVYHLLKALHEGLGVPGDVCEFGVAQGVNAAILGNEILDTDRRLWLFDSYEGLPPPSAEDELLDDIFELGRIERYAGRMAHGPEQVRARLTEVGFPAERTEIVAGFIEETSRGAHLPEAVCFAYLDFDFYDGTKTALELLHPRMAPGARVVVDDYGFFSSGVEKAVRAFVAAHEGHYAVEPNPPDPDLHFATLPRVPA